MEILCFDPAGGALYDLDVLFPIWRVVPFSWELSLPTLSREAVCLVTGPKREHGLAWELLTIKEFIFLSPSLFPFCNGVNQEPKHAGKLTFLSRDRLIRKNEVFLSSWEEKKGKLRWTNNQSQSTATSPALQPRKQTHFRVNFPALSLPELFPKSLHPHKAV